MRLHTTGKALLAAAVCVVSLSACGNAQQSSNSLQVDNAANGSSGQGRSGGPADCAADQLKPSFVLSTTGSAAGYVSVTNEGSEPCVLDSDYPTIEFLNRDAQPVEDVTYLQGEPGTHPLTLAPGEVAAAELDWKDMGDDCVARVWAMGLKVRPDDPAKSVDPMLNDKPWVFDLCGNEVTADGWRRG
ncbi:DUF4232 domain-containing protein [Saccharopolyspora sp. NPDC002686]|uniref:DUF4232 domain-containing protein n=1 Tax=Saccharopolyspora sp. NPDC002686 TaxID=3154541 RepID=UPI0033290712